MYQALSIGATGLQAQQANVEAIASNLANVQTTGYKKARVVFSELVVPPTLAPRARADGAGPLAAMQGTGMGVATPTPLRLFEGGDLSNTGSQWDLAIQGDGFLELAMPDGSRAYTRGGTLQVNADGQLAIGGIPLKPGLLMPDNAEALLVSASGRVQVRIAGQSTPIEAGQVEMVRFSNPPGLLAQGGNVYRATDASGEPIGGKPGEDGVGTLAQGALEGSNVKLVDEMVNLLVAQRSYEASAKVVQASDEMLGIINGLRK